MNFRVLTTDSFDQLVAGWGLEPALRREMYRRLIDDLSIPDPSTKLRRVVAPVSQMQYGFVLPDPGNPQKMHRFFFRIVYGQDEQSLIAIDAGYSRDE
jgi:hypothetical protein